jgi:hypothetical protein
LTIVPEKEPSAPFPTLLPVSIVLKWIESETSIDGFAMLMQASMWCLRSPQVEMTDLRTQFGPCALERDRCQMECHPVRWVTPEGLHAGCEF